MRKTVIAIPAVFLLFLVLCGCSKKSIQQFEPVREGSYRFTLRHEKLTAQGMLTVNGPNLYQVRFSEPESLRYIRYSMNDDMLTVFYGDHKENASFGDLPDGSVLKLMLTSLNIVLYSTHDFSVINDNTFVAEPQVLNQTVSAFFLNDGCLQKIEYPSAAFVLEFKKTDL